MATGKTEKILSAADTFTDPLKVTVGPHNQGKYNVSVAESGGPFVGTITMQRSFDGEVTWHDIPDGIFTAPDEKVANTGEDLSVRGGFKAGEYTSGSALVRISQKI